MSAHPIFRPYPGHKDLASTMRYLKAGYGKDLLDRVNVALEVIASL